MKARILQGSSAVERDLHTVYVGGSTPSPAPNLAGLYAPAEQSEAGQPRGDGAPGSGGSVGALFLALAGRCSPLLRERETP